MIRRIKNRFFTCFRSDEDAPVITLVTSQIYLKSNTLWVDIYRSLKDEIIFWYNYIFKFKSATVSLKEIKCKWDHLPCEDTDDWHNGYKWGKLKESILSTGTYGILYITKRYNDLDYNYRVRNGNHRIGLLKCIYGLDYKIKIRYEENYDIEFIRDTRATRIKLLDGKTDLEVVPIKVKISDIQHDYDGATLEQLYDSKYRVENNIREFKWVEFIDHISEEGIQELPLLELHSTRTYDKKEDYNSKTYLIYDGNHRIKALELLYGEDYEINADLIISKSINKDYLKRLKQDKLETANLVIEKRMKELQKKLIK
jgi:hypothetical protein